MTTKSDAIISAVIANLATITDFAGRVQGDLLTSVTRETAPAASVEPRADDPEDNSIGYTDWVLLLRIVVMVRSDTVRADLDDLRAQIHAKLMGDSSVGGLAFDTFAAGANWENSLADMDAGKLNLDYRFRYRTRVDDLTE